MYALVPGHRGPGIIKLSIHEHFLQILSCVLFIRQGFIALFI